MEYEEVVERAREILEELYGARVLKDPRTNGNDGGLNIEPEYDENGDAILYHGSPYKGIKKFQPGETFLSTVPEYSAGYAVSRKNPNGPQDVEPEGNNLYKVRLRPEAYKRLIAGGADLNGEWPAQDIGQAIENSIQRVLDDQLHSDVEYEIEPMELTPELLERAAFIDSERESMERAKRLLEVAMKLRGKF